MWADYSAPLRFHDEQTINFTLRPTLTLARAAIEASAQAVWLMDTTDPIECIRRHISLMHCESRRMRTGSGSVLKRLAKPSALISSSAHHREG